MEPSRSADQLHRLDLDDGTYLEASTLLVSLAYPVWLLHCESGSYVTVPPEKGNLFAPLLSKTSHSSIGLPDRAARISGPGRSVPIEGVLWEARVPAHQSHHRCCCIYYASWLTLVRAWIFRIANGPVIKQRSNQMSIKDSASGWERVK